MLLHVTMWKKVLNSKAAFPVILKNAFENCHTCKSIVLHILCTLCVSVQTRWSNLPFAQME